MQRVAGNPYLFLSDIFRSIEMATSPHKVLLPEQMKRSTPNGVWNERES
jgi:hypothetical protein